MIKVKKKDLFKKDNKYSFFQQYLFNLLECDFLNFHRKTKYNVMCVFFYCNLLIIK